MKYFGASDVGLLRKQNQDCYAIAQNEHGDMLAIVCDGIGGGLAGDVASKMGCNHIRDRFLNNATFQDDQDVKRWLKTTIQEANDLIFMQASKSLAQKGMGTTCVGMVYALSSTYIFNVGDSRIYGVYGNDFVCLSEDHSFVQDLLKAGEISEEEAKNHPNRNMLTNALGIWDNVKIDINKIKNDYQYLLICSDGLHGYVAEHLIYDSLVANKDIRDKTFELIELSKHAGGFDNVSVIVLEKEAGDVHE